MSTEYTPDDLDRKAHALARREDPRATRISWKLACRPEAAIVVRFRAGGEWREMSEALS